MEEGTHTWLEEGDGSAVMGEEGVKIKELSPLFTPSA